MSIGRVPGATGIQPSIVDAKGDLIAATAADSVSRLAVGANGTVLTADSAEATGLKWAASTVSYPYTTWTPTYTNLTVGNGTVLARYCQIDKFIHAEFRLTFGSTTSISGGVKVTLPVTAKTSGDGVRGMCVIFDPGNAGYLGHFNTISTTEGDVQVYNVAGTYAAMNNLTSTVPMTWGTGDIIMINMVYEAA